MLPGLDLDLTFFLFTHERFYNRATWRQIPFHVVGVDICTKLVWN
jgi:hypothetical protein